METQPVIPHAAHTYKIIEAGMPMFPLFFLNNINLNLSGFMLTQKLHFPSFLDTANRYLEKDF